MQFANRIGAGRLLAKKLHAYANRSDVIVLALPRGGVPVAYEVARALDAPLDVFLVRKLGVPGQAELAMGAIATGNVRILNEDVVNYLGIPDDLIDQVAAREQRELARRENLYRGASEPLNVSGRTVIVVDDGLATGSTMRAAVKALKRLGPAKIIVAAPVAARETCESFKAEVDSTCVCVMSPEPFDGVGLWYREFSQTTDEEVCYLLKHAKQPPRASPDWGASGYGRIRAYCGMGSRRSAGDLPHRHLEGDYTMRTREISRSEWPEFFDSFSRKHEGWLVTLEIFGSEIGAQLEVRELALEGIVAEWDEVKGDEIAIMIGAKPDNHITHNINRPTQVSLEQTDEGADVALAIKSADGLTALMRFRSALLPEMVDGVVTQPSRPSL